MPSLVFAAVTLTVRAMPCIFDRYLLRNFFRVLAITLCSLTGIYIVLHLFTNFEEFLSVSADGGMVRVLCDFYGPRALEFLDRTGAIAVLLSAIVTLTSLMRTNELTAIVAAGIPKGRLVTPLLWGAAVMSLVSAANREWGLPSVRESLTRTANDWRGLEPRPLRPVYDYRTDLFIGGRQTISAERKITEPQFRLPPAVAEGSPLGNQIAGQAAVYQNKTAEHPAGYLVQNVTIPEDVAAHPSLSLSGQPLVLTPRDHGWLAPNQCFVVTDVSFEQLASGSYWRQLSSSMELVAALRNPSLDLGGDARVMIHARLVQPLLDISLFLLGLPLILARDQRNVFVAAGMCLGLVAMFFVVVLVCHVLGSSYLVSPALGAWLPLMIFGPLAYIFSVPLWKATGV